MEEERVHGLSVADLLRLPHFQDAVLLGGREGLAQPISRVNVMEVPDVVDWVRPGEFLVTTGYPFRQEPEIMKTLIAELAGKGVAALGIKTKRFIDAVPDSAVRAADEHGLPLIELPPATAFSDVVREVMERVLVQESRQLSTLQNRVQRLSRVLLHGDGLSAFLRLLESMIGNPVALLDANDQWMASPGAEAICRALGEAGWRKVRQDSPLETSLLPLEHRTIRVHCSVVLEGMRPYLLLMLEDRPEYGIIDTLTLNWASKLVGFEISNAQARQKIEAKYIDQFLQDWLAGRILSPIDLKLRAEACGCPLADHVEYCAGIVRFPEQKPKARLLQEAARLCNADRTPDRKELKWAVLEQELVVLVGLPHGLPLRKETAGNIAALLRQSFAGHRFQLCFGRKAGAHEAVPASLREARRTAEVSSICRIGRDIVHYSELGVYLLLYRLIGTEEAEEFKRNYLQPLLDYDQKLHNQGALVKTLKMFFECNGNVKETAERLFLHYNTVAYRLERIKSEFGISLDDAEARLQLHLAIKLHEIKEL